MSGTSAAFDLGCPQPAAAPWAYDLVKFPSLPLQAMLVLLRIEQPERFTMGAPLSDNETWDYGWPSSSARIQESSASAILAEPCTATFIWLILITPSTVVGTDAVTLPL